MKCSLVCHDHFLYYDLPKKNLLEKVIQLLSLTFFLLTLMDEFVFRQRGGGPCSPTHADGRSKTGILLFL